MSFIPNAPFLDGTYRNPGPQRVDVAWHRRFMATMFNRDALRLTDTTKNSSSTTTAPLIPVQRFTSPAPPNLPPDPVAMRAGTTTMTTARNGAAARNAYLNGAS